MRDEKPILLVEDDVVDRKAVQRALKDLGITKRLHMARDGEEALACLTKGDMERPCIILLDLNMPRMNGIEFLKAIKQDLSLRAIPVVVLTTSKEEKDRVESFGLGVAGYMIKPVNYSQFVDVMRAIKDYWTLSELSE